MQSESDYTLLAKGLVERIGQETGAVVHSKIARGKEKHKLEIPIADHTAGIGQVLQLLTDKEWGVLNSLSEIEAVGHRVAQGGKYFSQSVVIDDDVIHKIESLCELAPLHNPAHLLGIHAVEKLLPQAKQVAVFDTAFHQTLPDYAYMYAIPYEVYKKYDIRKYGFHGTSHKYVAAKGCAFTGLDENKSKVITCHLGNGASITAIHGGKSIDTSMGFTPLEGLVMGTRCGDIDASVVTFLQEKEGWGPEETNNFLNKKCGLQGIYGPSSDCRDIDSAAADGNRRAQLAQNSFSYRVLKYIGSYAAAMNGVDLVVFTGGIGENDTVIREYIGTRLEYLGVHFDKEKNRATRGEDALLSTPDSKVKVAVITTNEELVIAIDTMHLCK